MPRLDYWGLTLPTVEDKCTPNRYKSAPETRISAGRQKVNLGLRIGYFYKHGPTLGAYHTIN